MRGPTTFLGGGQRQKYSSKAAREKEDLWPKAAFLLGRQGGAGARSCIQRLGNQGDVR